MATRKTAKKKVTRLSAKPAVLVTDSHRGIYFGYLRERNDSNKTVVLEGMRHCYYYTTVTTNEGVYGLATSGPGKGSKVGPRVTATVFDVAKIVECSPEAVSRWEASSWGG